MTHILIVEDDTLISDMIKKLLFQNGYSTTTAYSGTEAILLLNQKSFDLILLDLMLPGMSGEAVLEKIKESVDTPVIGVSSKTDTESKINLIRRGADDYLTKPFDNKELLVRIEAVLRRYQKGNSAPEEILRFKDLTLNSTTLEVKIKNEQISLTRYEFLILKLLMTNPDRVFTKNIIYESVWNENFEGEENAINVHIGNLRKKFSKVIPDEPYIQTVWGLGFKMQ
ncbi:response regulator transcription factor [Paenibacillus crassostreae]|uniref:XRE family transcriptional regulator n=1 Tax=Paenibacillus crassostreae TaxID=1763538 RepID=A0A167BCF0_9BACL|nr:response regulator transcription factor [Paenibacillus crassostreae]AOZ92970.1 DNA-binding response regulator [Paenibacillus crassostreae]OAB71941.1 XRE family transcriptional regulator [Paenibacillus crassostreae]